MTHLQIHTKVGSTGTDYILRQWPSKGDPDVTIPRKDEEKIPYFLSAVDVVLNRCELTVQYTSLVLLWSLTSSRLDMYQAKPFTLKVGQNTRRWYRPL